MTQKYLDPAGPFWQLRPLRLVFCYWKGSIFQVFWIELVVVAALYTVALVTSYYLQKNVLEEDVSEFVREAEVALGYIHSRYQAALSLMLSFYTATIFKRWWATGSTEVKALGVIEELSMQIVPFVFENETEEKAEEDSKEEVQECAVETVPTPTDPPPRDPTTPADARFHLVRWLNLSHALVVGHVYEKQSNEFSSLESLEKLGLLTSAEHKYMKRKLSPETRYTAPLLWFLQTLRQLKVHSIGDVVDASIVMANNSLSKLRSHLNDLYLYKNIPIPLLYRQLVNFTVRFYMVIVALYVAINDIAKDETWGFSPHGSYWLLLVVFFEYFVFVGWLTVADALGNPFRTWSDQYEWENAVRKAVVDTHVLLTETAPVCPALTELASLREQVSKKQANSIEYLTDEILDSANNPDLKGCRRVERTLTGY